jgi:galactose mutarotase-like enzyme
MRYGAQVSRLGQSIWEFAVTPETLTVANAHLCAEIALQGAELVRLGNSSGVDFLWNGDPQFWAGRAPLLFPMVGRAAGDQIKVDGRHHALPQHGFARRCRFELVSAAPSRCVLRLRANDETRAAFPFAFRLDVAYELRDSTLVIAAEAFNEGDVALPCAFGFHPAFRWPLPGGEGAHEIVFDQEETAPIRLLADGLLAPEDHPNPIAGRRLPLDPALFERGALIFDRLASRRACFRAERGPSVAISFKDMPHFGLWTKPGAPFLCLEPWQGFAAPQGFDGEFAARPGVVLIAPGASRVFTMEIELRP